MTKKIDKEQEYFFLRPFFVCEHFFYSIFFANFAHTFIN